MLKLGGEFGIDYKGPLGQATKSSIYDPGADRFTQEILGTDPNWSSAANEYAGQLVSQRAAMSRFGRDITADLKNPRQELPKDVLAMQLMGVPDLLNQPAPDVSRKEDYEAHNQVKLVQNAILHHQEQENMYTDPKLFGRDDLNTERTGRQPQPMTQDQLYSLDGSAAGRESNFLDGDGYRTRSVESTVAF